MSSQAPNMSSRAKPRDLKRPSNDHPGRPASFRHPPHTKHVIGTKITPVRQSSPYRRAGLRSGTEGSGAATPTGQFSSPSAASTPYRHSRENGNLTRHVILSIPMSFCAQRRTSRPMAVTTPSTQPCHAKADFRLTSVILYLPLTKWDTPTESPLPSDRFKEKHAPPDGA